MGISPIAASHPTWYNHCVGLHVVHSVQYFCVEWCNSFGLRTLSVDLSAGVMLTQHSTHTSPFSLHTDCYFYLPDSFIILTLALYLPWSMTISPSYFSLPHLSFYSTLFAFHLVPFVAIPPPFMPLPHTAPTPSSPSPPPPPMHPTSPVSLPAQPSLWIIFNELLYSGRQISAPTHHWAQGWGDALCISISSEPPLCY